MGEVVATRVRFSGSPRRPRNARDRFMVRFPGVWRRVSAYALGRLEPRSRLRRALLRQEMVSAYAAANRRDYELMLVRYSRDLRVEFDPDLAALGLAGTFEGHAGLLAIIDAFGGAWEDWELRPELVIDLGDGRFLGLGRFRMTVGGLEFEPEFAQLLAFDRGLVASEHEFLDWERGLRAAGLDPAAVQLPPRADPASRRAVVR